MRLRMLRVSLGEANMRKLGLGIVLAGMLLAGGARAGTVSGQEFNVQELLSDCKTPTDDPRNFYCLGVATGVEGVMIMNGAMLPSVRPGMSEMNAFLATS